MVRAVRRAGPSPAWSSPLFGRGGLPFRKCRCRDSYPMTDDHGDPGHARRRARNTSDKRPPKVWFRILWRVCNWRPPAFDFFGFAQRGRTVNTTAFRPHLIMVPR